jgi:hypothetical protein
VYGGRTSLSSFSFQLAVPSDWYSENQSLRYEIRVGSISEVIEKEFVNQGNRVLLSTELLAFLVLRFELHLI